MCLEANALPLLDINTIGSCNVTVLTQHREVKEEL